jgi:tetratricopeptide (TPR) repeat protein
MNGDEIRKKWVAFAFAIVLCNSLLAQTNGGDQVSVHYGRAQDALRSNQLEIAAKEFREILRLEPDSAEAYANLGVIAYKERDYTQAEQSFSAALKLNSALWDAQAFVGLCELHLGRPAEAKVVLEKSFAHIRNQTVRAEVGMDLISMDQQTNNLDHAVDVIRELARSSPTDPNVLYLAYRTYSDLAAQALATLAKTSPDSVRMHQVLAQAAASQDDIQGAIAEYRKAIAVNAQMPGLHYELGRVLLASSQDESVRQEARREFEAELALNPTDANSEYELGEVYSLQSDLPLASEHYSRALKLQPNLANAHVALAKVLSSQGKSSEALAHLLEAERLDPDNEMAHYRLAQAYRESGQSNQAERELALFKKVRDSRIPTRPVSSRTSAER